MRTALAISASSLLIIVVVLPDGALRWWVMLVGLACIWLLRLVAEQERRVEHHELASLERSQLMRDLHALHTAAATPPVDPPAETGEY